MSAGRSGAARRPDVELERAEERAGSTVADAAIEVSLARVEPARCDTVPVAATLARLAELHADLADAYAALAVESGEVRLADPADPSVHASVTTGFHPAEYLTQAALGDLIGAHPRTVRRMELAGELPDAIEIGRLKRWRRSTVQTWLDEGCPNPRRARR